MPFSKLFPSPSADIDPIGQNLRELDRTITALQFTDPIRLYGDKSIVAGAIMSLKIVLDRIEALQPSQADAAE